MKIGVICECFKTDLKDAIKKAAKLGLDGVQIYATGVFSPDTLTAERKEEYKKLLKDNNLSVSALCGDMGGYGFEIAADNSLRIEKTKRIIELAAEFSSDVVTTHIGVIPKDKSDARYGAMLAALTECGLYAKSKGVTLAIETGPEPADSLLSFLKDTKGGVGVNLDPANFVMITGQDPVKAVRMLKDYIVHTHAKDGIRLIEKDAGDVYHAFVKGGAEAEEAFRSFKEVPLGCGGVNWGEYMAALRETGYDGFLTIEREGGENPASEIEEAAEFLKKII